ncbi:MAG: ABC transporter permease [Firmicutes bacterium]|nr:ABC transporter permease [Bacillota bacterium]
MKILALARKNLGRHRGRTILSLIAVALGVAIIIFTKGYTEGMINDLLNNHIRLMAGHVRIIHPEYQKKERLLSLTLPVEGYTDGGLDEMLAQLEEMPETRVVAPRIKFGALVPKDEKTEGVLGVAVRPQAEEELARISQYVGEGRWLQKGREVVVGSKFLQEMGLEVGDEITVVANSAYGSLRARSYRVVGAFASGLKYLDENTIYMTLPEGQDLLEMPGQATEILLGLKDGDAGPIVFAEKYSRWQKEKYGQEVYTAVPWQKSSPLIETALIEKAVYHEIYLLIAVLSAFVVFNTMMMIVNERRREIGMLKALGMTRRQIIGLFLGEGLYISVIGGLMGVAIGGAATWYLSQNPLDFSAIMKTLDKNLLFYPKIYFSSNVADLFYAFFVGVVVTLIASFLPARRGSKLPPSEALRSL